MSRPWINNMLDVTTMLVYVNEDMDIVKPAIERYGESCYQRGRADVLNELMDIRDGLPFKYADKWTSRDSEAITMLFSEYEQIKEQKNDY